MGTSVDIVRKPYRLDIANGKPKQTVRTLR
jgi:hypothetical protein